jgi:hypothetical protein
MTTRSTARSVPFLAVPLLGLLALLPGAARAADGDPTLQERVAALKQSLAESQKALRTYQWVETTTVSMKGEVKSQKQMSCYYGADGALQKQPLSAPPPPPAKKKGLKGKIVESKKEELTGTMKKAVALVKSYLPPDPARIQQAKDAGKATVEVVEPGKMVRLSFRDYQLPGDTLAITLDPATNRLAGIQVTTYLDKPSNPVDLKVTMGTLADGTVYSASTQLEVKAEKVAVNIANTGYKHAN